MTVYTGSGRAQCCCVKTLTNVWVLQKAGNFLTTWTFLSFTVRILLHGITTRVNNIPSNTVVFVVVRCYTKLTPHYSHYPLPDTAWKSCNAVTTVSTVCIIFLTLLILHCSSLATTQAGLNTVQLLRVYCVSWHLK